MSFDGARHELELRADVARDRLLETIGAIDRKRHEVLDWKLQLRQHAGQVVVVSAAFLGCMAFALGAGIYRAKVLASRRRGERVRALERFWEHPERIAVRRSRPVRAALLSALVALVSAATARMFEARG
jgi:hypothetical protein